MCLPWNCFAQTRVDTLRLAGIEWKTACCETRHARRSTYAMQVSWMLAVFPSSSQGYQGSQGSQGSLQASRWNHQSAHSKHRWNIADIALFYSWGMLRLCLSHVESVFFVESPRLRLNFTTSPCLQGGSPHLTLLQSARAWTKTRFSSTQKAMATWVSDHIFHSHAKKEEEKW